MKAYFNRNIPLYLDTEGFDAVPVEVDPVVLQNIADLRRLMVDVDKMIANAGAPEDSAQIICDFFAEEVRKIFKTRKQDNRNG